MHLLHFKAKEEKNGIPEDHLSVLFFSLFVQSNADLKLSTIYFSSFFLYLFAAEKEREKEKERERERKREREREREGESMALFLLRHLAKPDYRKSLYRLKRPIS